MLLVGDAAGYVDALTGEGIALGLAQARAAVDAVVAERPAALRGGLAPRWRRRHDLLTRGLLAATRRARRAPRLVPAAPRLPGVFGAAVNQLARPA